MILVHKPEHDLKSALIEHGVGHLVFRTEAGCDAFKRDNKATIRNAMQRETMDFEIQLTITAK